MQRTMPTPRCQTWRRRSGDKLKIEVIFLITEKHSFAPVAPLGDMMSDAGNLDTGDAGIGGSMAKAEVK